MTGQEPRRIWLSDYRPFTHLVDRAELIFRLDSEATNVRARLHMRPNPDVRGAHILRLDGEGLRLISLRLDGAVIDVTPDETGLSIPGELLPDAPFIIESEVEISPATNTALEGLYMSKGMYCTQCEPEGFRHITFYPDRPDVMARFHVRVESGLPILLSNGNPVAEGDGWAEWDDPWPKPAYLFALVAGDLVAHRDHFTTMSGRKVELAIWVRPGDEDRCAYAMDSLKRAMKWDEDEYGREYDLSVFNIVAVDDFNMGAMENKGLNVFNSKLVLASPETATDGDFARIEAVIGHEYFHNWTGNRVTCRDWFQLCLKEGLTVFRDQSFSAAMRSPSVKRIEDALVLRARQFREDQGPLAHPVRPESYIEINNFYTPTVYEKGAEIARMLKELVGDAGYRKALDLYFTRHDGHACTIEDWLGVFEDATGHDLTQFSRWYHEAGTPHLRVVEDWQDGTYTLTFTQENPPTPGQPDKQPKLLPIAVGLLNPNGDEVVPTTVLEMTEASQSFQFEGLGARPVPSILRGFSAPLVLERDTTAEERAFLLAHDTDLFNKWEAGRGLALDMLKDMVVRGADPAAGWLGALERVVHDAGLDPAFRALVLNLPSEDDIAHALYVAGVTPDPDAVHAAREQAIRILALKLAPTLLGLVASFSDSGVFSSDAASAGRRALRLSALNLLGRVDKGEAAEQIYMTAGNMTEKVGALTALLDIGKGEPQLAQFEARWKGVDNVMDKWFMLQIVHSDPTDTVDIVERLTRHPDFNWGNPNRFRSVIGGLTANHAGFHHASGRGYRLLADWLLILDPVNPQTAARMSAAYETWPRYDEARQRLIRAELERILATPALSRDLSEMTTRLLAGKA